MAELGVIVSVVDLVSTAFAITQEIRRVRTKIKGASKTLENLSKQIEILERSLKLVKDEDRLQTAGVAQQVEVINAIAKELETFLDQLAAEQQKKVVTQFFHTLKSGDKEDKALEQILDRLDRARSELNLRISIAQVGLVGNLQDGFQVAFDVLIETNKKVKDVLGTNLQLVDLVQSRFSNTRAGDIIPLETSDVQSLALMPSVQSTPDISNDCTRETLIMDNITRGQAHVMTGDVGVLRWDTRVSRKATVKGNVFGGGLQLMTGNMGGKSAENFNENFWR